MAILPRNRNRQHQLSFEDLRGLRAEGYIRDSTLDQKDGFGPEIQRHNEERFAEAYGLVLGDRWYTEFVSGRNVEKRREFQQLREDAALDLFDVLLVDHTSRFGRNQAECIRHKEELAQLGKIIVFVSQGIISGSDRDFLSERINETLDEQYSRNLSRYVIAGMAEKAAHGYANGLASLGYKSEALSGRKAERKAPDPETIPILLMLLADYASGEHSYSQVADRLNAQGHRTRNGRPFTGHTVKDILANRFYEGKVVYHAGQPDEEVWEGVHEVPEEIKDLWLECQQVKRQRRLTTAGHPRGPKRSFPFARVLTCNRCGYRYHGEAFKKSGSTDLRLVHQRRGPGRVCDARPRSRSVASLVEEFGQRVMVHMHLDGGWKGRIIKALQQQQPAVTNDRQVERLKGALENLRKQHLWGDLNDEGYQRERTGIERQLKIAVPPAREPQLPNLERAAELLSHLPALWVHPGVDHEQRETLLRQVFDSINIDGDRLVAVAPQPVYAPLFATMVTDPGVGYWETESPPSPPETRT